MGSFGEWLRAEMELRHVSVRGLAHMMGVAPTQVQQLRDSVKTHPREETLQRVADALNIDIDTVRMAAGLLPENMIEAVDVDTLRLQRALSQLEPKVRKRFVNAFITTIER